MLTLHLKNKEYTFPNSWEELSAEQFIYLTSLLRLFQTGVISVDEVRILFFLKISGLMPRRFRTKEKQELFSENVHRAASMINFYFKNVYENHKAFLKLNAKVREMITRHDPDDLPDEVNIRAARKLKRHLEVDAVFPANLIHKIPGTKLDGYRFVLRNEFVDTSLTASQYVDAYSVFENWSKKNDTDSLDLMVAILYQGEDYSAEKAHQMLDTTRIVSYDAKHAVMLNYMAIHLFLAQRTKYAILFTGSGSDKNGNISLGFHDSIYSLIKAGYGEVEKVNLIKFLDLMLKELKDGVKALHDAEMKLEDIASKSKLTISQVKSLL